MQGRIAAGADPVGAADYRAFYASPDLGATPRSATAALKDGRTVQVHSQLMPDGGWVSTHEVISPSREEPTSASERISMQTLIDWVPDNLWVKDRESRFVIANKATALRMGYAGSGELIGKTDLELCRPEIARQYYADEQRIIASGQPMIEDVKEEVIAVLMNSLGF